MSLNVPRAYDLLIGALRTDAALRERFFSRLQVLFYAGAALPQSLWEALRELALQTLGREVPVISSWGLTETAPMATICHSRTERTGVVGLPIPGCELKLVRTGDKLEAYVRGPNVTTGYFKRHDLTANAFDGAGFFKTGDALRFVDAERPERGLLFDGRLAENFKLSTATWVQAGALRVEAIAALSPIAQDVVVAGHDRDEVGLLVFPNLDACRHLCADLPNDASPALVLEHPAVRSRVAAGLVTLEEAGTGSSNCVRRALLLLDPPSIDAGEITDKGYVNQRAVLQRRAALVDRLYRNPPDPGVVLVPQSDTRVTRVPESR
jgi:feruloyl-CoA synthase